MGGFFCQNLGPEKGKSLLEGTQLGMGRWEFPALPTVPSRNPLSAPPSLSPSPSEHFLSVLLPLHLWHFFLPLTSSSNSFFRTQLSITYSRKPPWNASPSFQFSRLRGVVFSFHSTILTWLRVQNMFHSHQDPAHPNPGLSFLVPWMKLLLWPSFTCELPEDCTLNVFFLRQLYWDRIYTPYKLLI